MKQNEQPDTGKGYIWMRMENRGLMINNIQILTSLHFYDECDNISSG